MPNTQSRVIGSGFTTLNYRGQAIAFLARFNDSGQDPLGQPPAEAVYVIGQKHAVEIATSRVLGIGAITMTIRELWNAPVWEQLSGLEGTSDIIDVYERLAADPTEVTCQMLIKPPGLTVWRGKIYHNCTVTGIDDGETVDIGTLTAARNVVVSYTHTNRFTISAGTVVA